MKKIIKATIIATILLFIGIVISAVSLGLIEKKVTSPGYSRNQSTLTEQTYETSPENLTKISTDLSSFDVVLKTTTEDKITVTYYDDVTSPRYSINCSDSELSIRNTHTNNHIINFIDWEEIIWAINDTENWDDNTKYTATIEIPETYAQAYDITTVSGDVRADSLPDCTDFKCLTTSGKVDFSNVKCSGDIDIKSTSGDITLKSINANGDCTLTTVSGNCKTESLTIDKKAEIETTSGEIESSEIICAELNATTVSGSIAFTSLEASDSIVANTVSGDITVSVPDSYSAYNITSSTTSGDNSLPTHSSVQDGKKLKVTTISGDISFTFDAK